MRTGLKVNKTAKEVGLRRVSRTFYILQIPFHFLRLLALGGSKQ